MATWGVHIRIAERLLGQFNDFDTIGFLVGNIGPDCGVPNADWSVFSPPKTVSHWLNESGQIDPDQFYQAYLQGEGERPEDGTEDDWERQSFLWGYYTHLLTDVEWSKMLKAKARGNEGLAGQMKDPKFIWTIKKDWYDLDHLYFRNNGDSIYHSVFTGIKEYPDYLDYFPAGAVERQVNYISNFYAKGDRDLDREYLYLTEEEMDAFVDGAVVGLATLLGEKIDQKTSMRIKGEDEIRGNIEKEFKYNGNQKS